MSSSEQAQHTGIVEARIELAKMREREEITDWGTDNKSREQRWFLQMNILAYQMALDRHDGIPYVPPWERSS